MNLQYIDTLIKKQKKFFQSGTTLSIEYRIKALYKLKKCINEKESLILDALKEDLGKNATEAYMCEVGLVLSEINYMLKNIRKLTREKTVKTPLVQFASRSYKKCVPLGNVLIMSPWNYPFLLTMDPLVDAIAAGNTAILKPSAYSPATASIIEEMIKDCFDEEYVAVIKGGRKENACLLEKKYDLIFFTGSGNVGKEVLRQCANHLTPAILELGGKSPCIVEESANIELAARRVIFGKFINCGQTCVAPDYILCHKDVKDELIKCLKNEITKQYGETPLENNNYGKIINEKHFKRLLSLINKNKVVHGGKSKKESLKIEPTIMDFVMWEDAIMQEEIFGPILPVLTYETFEDLYTLLKDREKPLALYIFSENKQHINEITERIPYGGGCINDCIIHLATSELGFGGVGESGMGSYHGKDGFMAFSHVKNIVDKKTWIDLPMRYQPFSEFNKKLIKIFLR